MQDHKAPWLVARVAVERLTQGIPVAALGVRSSRTPDIARIARSSGHHAIWVDLEHSTMPIDTAALICAAAVDLGLAPLNHRQHLVERYFPNASHQVVVLSTDTEVDRQYYDLLQPAIARAYHLNYDEKSRMTIGQEGYFWAD